MLPNHAWRIGLNRVPKPISFSTSFEYESQYQRTNFRRLATPPSRQRSHPAKSRPSEDFRRVDTNGHPGSHPRAPLVTSLCRFFCATAYAVFRLFFHLLWTSCTILLQPVRLITRNLAGPLVMVTFVMPLALLLFLAVLNLAPGDAAEMLRLPAPPVTKTHSVLRLSKASEPAIRIDSPERSRDTEAALFRLSLDVERSRSNAEEEARLIAQRLQRLEDALARFSLHYERTRSEIAVQARRNAEQAEKSASHAAVSSELNSIKKDFEALQLLVKASRPSRHIARPDFALHSSGASVIPSLTSPTYTLRRSTLPGRIFEYFTHYGALTGRPPVTSLHYDIHDGHCWPFAGSHGQLGIVLAAPIYIEDITIDHVASAVAVNRRTSAPRDMEVWAMVEGQDNIDKLEAWREEMTQWQEHGPARPTMLANYPEFIRIASFQYDIYSPDNIQTFPVDAEIRRLGIDIGVVVLVVKSNWGMEEYTCLYRIRVHGTPR
ncbi:hypothetical protein B0H11DRAFT_1924838 [Mycena galericulata]|nr:hypothetical protein B0H11DRAFT_1924838 [Mycena galericulata]